MREQLVSGDVAARKSDLASIVDAVIVSENKIRIMGSNDNSRSTFGPKGHPTPVLVNLFRNGAQGRDRTTDTAIFSHHIYVFVVLPDVALLEIIGLSHQLVC
jgi:hypothetical protein